MSCPRTASLLQGALEAGALSRGPTAHAAECPECRAAWEELARLSADLEDAAGGLATSRLDAQVTARIGDWRVARARRRRRLAASAALALALACGFAAGRLTAPATRAPEPRPVSQPAPQPAPPPVEPAKKPNPRPPEPPPLTAEAIERELRAMENRLLLVPKQSLRADPSVDAFIGRLERAARGGGAERAAIQAVHDKLAAEGPRLAGEPKQIRAGIVRALERILQGR